MGDGLGQSRSSSHPFPLPHSHFHTHVLSTDYFLQLLFLGLEEYVEVSVPRW